MQTSCLDAACRSQTLRFREQREAAEAQLSALQAQEASLSQQATTAQAASSARVAELAGVSQMLACTGCRKYHAFNGGMNVTPAVICSLPGWSAIARADTHRAQTPLRLSCNRTSGCEHRVAGSADGLNHASVGG